MITELVLIGFASWRLASLFVDEDGPFDVFLNLRTELGVPRIAGEIKGFVPKLFSCIWCFSIWLVPFVWLLYQIEDTIVLIIAAMTVVLIAEKYIRG